MSLFDDFEKQASMGESAQARDKEWVVLNRSEALPLEPSDLPIRGRFWPVTALLSRVFTRHVTGNTAGATAPGATVPAPVATSVKKASARVALAAAADQEDGAFRDLSGVFRRLRQPRARQRRNELNKLALHVTKLRHMYDAPGPGYKLTPWKKLEQQTLPGGWQSKSEVTACPRCGDSFVRGTTKDHCRVCGQVVCTECLCNVPLPAFGKPAPRRLDMADHSVSKLLDMTYHVKVCTSVCLDAAIPNERGITDHGVARLCSLHDEVSTVIAECNYLLPGLHRLIGRYETDPASDVSISLIDTMTGG